MLRPVPRSYPRHVAWCSLALLFSVAACVPTAASAQWQTDDGGTWGARRCQSRNLISAGLVLGASGLPLLQNPEHAGIGIGVLLTGTAVAATGIGLRIRLGGDPGRAGEHDLAVVNRSGRDLRAVILRLPDGDFVYAAKLKDGDRLLASAATKVSALPDGAYWKAQVEATVRAGSLDVHHLASGSLSPLLAQDAPGLSEAWGALEDAEIGRAHV